MPAGIITYPKFKAFDTNGQLLAGGKLYTYVTGTSTPKTTYSDAAMTTPNTNPVVLDALGEAVVYGLGVFKLVLQDAAGAAVWTQDSTEFASPGVVKASSSDASAGYLVDKLVAGSNITLTKVNPGANEELSIAASGLPTAVATGSADAIVVSYSPAITLASNVVVAFQALGANASSAPTFTPNGLTTYPITKNGGLPLDAGDIPRAGFVALLQYDSANHRWELLNAPNTTTSPPFQQGVVNGSFQVWQRGDTFAGLAGGVTKTIFLTTPGAGTWAVPGDWNNANNSVVCIGGGGGGVGSGTNTQFNGGGGGAFAKRTNLTLTGTLNYSVGAGSAGASGGGTAPDGGDTWINSAAMPASGTLTAVGAKGGGGASAAAAGLGGSAANSCGSTTNAGGAGGASGGSGSGGGGGAGGPNGPGGAGGSVVSSGGGGGGGSGGGGSGTGGFPGSSIAGGAGGNNSAGVGAGSSSGGAGSSGGGGGGATSSAGGPGGAGMDFTATAGGTAGPGGGGGGAFGPSSTIGGTGGLYGGGGGGSDGPGTPVGGAGAQGIIIIQYTPAAGLVYTADCWFAGCGGTGPAGELTKVAGTNGFKNALKLQRPAANTAVGAHQIGHVLLSADCARYAGQAVSLSFEAKAGANFSASGNLLAVKLYTGTGADEGAAAMLGGIWAGSALAVNATQALTTGMVRYSFTGVIPADATEIGLLLGWTPTGTASADDSITVQGVALKPVSAGAVSVFDFPTYDLDLYACRTRCEIVAGYVPATTAQNIRALHMRSTPTITGGGSGFTSTGTTKDALIAFQTTGAVQTLTLTSDL